MTFRMRRTASRCNARRRMALMPGRREAAATLAAPGASAYLRGATREARNFPGALPLKADTELKETLKNSAALILNSVQFGTCSFLTWRRAVRVHIGRFLN